MGAYLTSLCVRAALINLLSLGKVRFSPEQHICTLLFTPGGDPAQMWAYLTSLCVRAALMNLLSLGKVRFSPESNIFEDCKVLFESLLNLVLTVYVWVDLRTTSITWYWINSIKYFGHPLGCSVSYLLFKAGLPLVNLIMLFCFLYLPHVLWF